MKYVESEREFVPVYNLHTVTFYVSLWYVQQKDLPGAHAAQDKVESAHTYSITTPRS